MDTLYASLSTCNKADIDAGLAPIADWCSLFFAAGNDGDKKASRIIGARYVWGVAYCAANGIMQGDADGTFRPGDTVTCAELATVIARLEARKEHT